MALDFVEANLLDVVNCRHVGKESGLERLLSVRCAWQLIFSESVAVIVFFVMAFRGVLLETQNHCWGYAGAPVSGHNIRSTS